MSEFAFGVLSTLQLMTLVVLAGGIVGGYAGAFRKLWTASK